MCKGVQQKVPWAPWRICVWLTAFWWVWVTIKCLASTTWFRRCGNSVCVFLLLVYAICVVEWVGSTTFIETETSAFSVRFYLFSGKVSASAIHLALWRQCWLSGRGNECILAPTLWDFTAWVLTWTISNFLLSSHQTKNGSGWAACSRHALLYWSCCGRTTSSRKTTPQIAVVQSI